ncbi:MAG: abortive infection family protein [Candidatus Electrothrix sp. Rat3]|nr:abortive infection family protein [Candidatus Electrothrix rattekaaiensis]
MEKLKQEIRRIKRYNLEYYHSHLSLIETYIEEKPDISIETCKALIEGISILALYLLNQEPINSHNNANFQDLFKRALSELQKERGYSDFDMVKRLGSVVHYLGTIRSSHGDICHGRASLKDQVNDADFAELIIGITDNLCTYMLRRLDHLSVKEVLYEDNPEFNDSLDEEHPMPGKILYSKALFDQEFKTYEIQLGDFILESEQEEE